MTLRLIVFSAVQRIGACWQQYLSRQGGSTPPTATQSNPDRQPYIRPVTRQHAGAGQTIRRDGLACTFNAPATSAQLERGRPRDKGPEIS
jgi:hypothetical protein